MKEKSIQLQLHNTLTGKKEAFQTLSPGKVKLYVCGITPYDEAHLGHGRCYVVFDVLKRILNKIYGEKNVTHVQNFTDVDDKIIERARAKGADPATYANQFIESYNHWMKELNVLPADVYPRVTGHIQEIINLIQTLIDKKLGYIVEGDVYYAVRKFSDYGELSHRKLDEVTSGARVEVDERKSDPLDFALWKSAKPGEPSWPSPWGPGRPGWHIECSAMSMKYLGEEFDIHGGGLDLVFPHHENENAQSRGATGRKKFAHTWVHNGFVTINKEKMSKSLGNFFTLKDLLTTYEPMAVRYFLLTQHYKSSLNFSDQDLDAAVTAWNDRIKGAYRLAVQWEVKNANEGEAIAEESDFWASMADDLNTPQALAALNNVCSRIFSLDSKKDLGLQQALRKSLQDMLDVLGLVVQEEAWSDEMKDLLAQREIARKAKDFKKSDEIRDLLKSKGAVVEDTSSGPRLKKI